MAECPQQAQFEWCLTSTAFCSAAICASKPEMCSWSAGLSLEESFRKGALLGRALTPLPVLRRLLAASLAAITSLARVLTCCDCCRKSSASCRCGSLFALFPPSTTQEQQTHITLSETCSAAAAAVWAVQIQDVYPNPRLQGVMYRRENKEKVDDSMQPRMYSLHQLTRLT